MVVVWLWETVTVMTVVLVEAPPAGVVAGAVVAQASVTVRVTIVSAGQLYVAGALK